MLRLLLVTFSLSNAVFIVYDII
ncbi:unnamed protein product [Victoria cruziana]